MLPVSAFGTSEWVFNPNLAITPGQEYFIGVDAGIVTTGSSDFILGKTIADPIAGTGWANLDNLGWYMTGGGTWDIASRIVMSDNAKDAPPVPEPGTYALFGLAAIGYGIYRRRRGA